MVECAVIGIEDKLKGEMPLAFVVLNNGVELDEGELNKRLKMVVRTQVGPIATPKDIHIVPRLPKTRSGKILRGTIRKIAEGKQYKLPATIEDPMVLDEISSVLADPTLQG